MLTAIDRDGRLCQLIEPETVDLKGDYYCPGCKGEVRLRQGKVVRPHFAHKHLADCSFQTENESAEHLELKGALYRWAVANSPVILERYLSDLGQVTDLFIGDKLALEVQCSPLSQVRLCQRSQAYRSKGYEVLWLLGKKLWLGQRLTALQKQFLYFSKNLGFYAWELDWDKQELRLKYLIHEDLRGSIQHLTRSFPFGEGDLLDCLRQPFARQPLVQFAGRLEPNPQTYIAQQLYYRSPKWLSRQASCYARGENLLTFPASAFYPQLRPVEGEDFCQIAQDLTAYYQCFEAYYQKMPRKNSQIVYSPAFYGKI